MRSFTILAALSLCACGPNIEGNGGTVTGEACTGTGSRCADSGYQECQGGFWTILEECTGGEVCAPSIGCAECDPAASRACVGDDVRVCNANGTLGSTVDTCPAGTCSHGSCGGSGVCDATGVDKIYLVDTSFNLLRFDPANGNRFTLVGRLNCNPDAPLDGIGEATPFSMSVDRTGRAWVLYSSGQIFWVSTQDASCDLSPYAVGQAGFDLFGMGFSADSPGAETEQLFIAGGAYDDLAGGALGVIDPVSLDATSIKPLPSAEYSPELTGTGDAKLYGYYPGTLETFVTEVNRDTAASGTKWFLPDLSGDVTAWAFAQWGGKFYVFVSTRNIVTLSETSHVFLLDPATGDADEIIPSSPYRVVGAGVSTCAPVVVE